MDSGIFMLSLLRKSSESNRQMNTVVAMPAISQAAIIPVNRKNEKNHSITLELSGSNIFYLRKCDFKNKQKNEAL